MSAAAAPKPAVIRRAPSDLTITFADEATVQRISAAAAEPEWLLADRLEGLRAFAALPIETNALYTTYVDLRNAHLADVHPITPLAGHAATDVSLLPEGAAAYAEIGEERVTALVLSPEARTAGVILETLSQTGARDPELLRELCSKAAARCPRTTSSPR